MKAVYGNLSTSSSEEGLLLDPASEGEDILDEDSTAINSSCAFAGMLEIQDVTLEGPLSTRMAAPPDGPYEGVADLTVPHPMLVSMSYFNAQREVFQAGNLVLSYGTLSVPDREDDPVSRSKRTV
jgi:hypothetical protein